MEYVYGHNIEHRDLKAENCLIAVEDGNYRAKLTDFGLSKSKDIVTQSTGRSSLNGAAGTATHMAPELLLTNSMTNFCQQSDVYSYGILMWEVLSRKIPFEGMNEAQIIAHLNEGKRPTPTPEDSPDDLIELMQECWAQSVGMRPKFTGVFDELLGAAEALNKPFFGSPLPQSDSPSPFLLLMRTPLVYWVHPQIGSPKALKKQKQGTISWRTSSAMCKKGQELLK